ncbi:glycosyltransferase family 2 protein [Colwellia sp. 1_MG-2023]|uniref:glycosyltransferase family 2 protein n=1 Tax=Colwellia sp. 1_MG-2023 TaxID=3062649 RepID=UPI0026E3262D|nr:glycosyltransferase family 2 protein [Colwellia sp. 1_MG-2023]MDO6444987.1 glycosyltransferase family 2 protein [Colwellia sp. 1_MG-2023]
MDKIAVVIPIYGSPNSLNELVERLIATLGELTKNYEVILVEDHCPKNSWEAVENLCLTYKEVKGIKFSKNFGQHYAILAGLRKTDADYVVVMDCDLQDHPEDIPALYKKIKQGFDKVFVKRINRKHSLLERFTSKIFYKFLSYMTDTQQDASIGNFGIYSRSVTKEISQLTETARLFPVHARWVGFNDAHIEIIHKERHDEGVSSYTFRKRLALAIDIALSFSEKPLWLVIKFGFSISALSFFYALYTLTNWLFGGVTVEGWTSLIISVWLLSGIIIAILGVVGVYVAKTFDETKSRPLYIIEKEINMEGM